MMRYNQDRANPHWNEPLRSCYTSPWFCLLNLDRRYTRRPLWPHQRLNMGYLTTEMEEATKIINEYVKSSNSRVQDSGANVYEKKNAKIEMVLSSLNTIDSVWEKSLSYCKNHPLSLEGMVRLCFTLIRDATKENSVMSAMRVCSNLLHYQVELNCTRINQEWEDMLHDERRDTPLTEINTRPTHFAFALVFMRILDYNIALCHEIYMMRHSQLLNTRFVRNRSIMELISVINNVISNEDARELSEVPDQAKSRNEKEFMRYLVQENEILRLTTNVKNGNNIFKCYLYPLLVYLYLQIGDSESINKVLMHLTGDFDSDANQLDDIMEATRGETNATKRELLEVSEELLYKVRQDYEFVTLEENPVVKHYAKEYERSAKLRVDKGDAIGKLFSLKQLKLKYIPPREMSILADKQTYANSFALPLFSEERQCWEWARRMKAIRNRLSEIQESIYFFRPKEYIICEDITMECFEIEKYENISNYLKYNRIDVLTDMATYMSSMRENSGYSSIVGKYMKEEKSQTRPPSVYTNFNLVFAKEMNNLSVDEVSPLNIITYVYTKILLMLRNYVYRCFKMAREIIEEKYSNTLSTKCISTKDTIHFNDIYSSKVRIRLTKEDYTRIIQSCRKYLPSPHLVRLAFLLNSYVPLYISGLLSLNNEPIINPYSQLNERDIFSTNSCDDINNSRYIPDFINNEIIAIQYCTYFGRWWGIDEAFQYTDSKMKHKFADAHFFTDNNIPTYSTSVHSYTLPYPVKFIKRCFREFCISTIIDTPYALPIDMKAGASSQMRSSYDISFNNKTTILFPAQSHLFSYKRGHKLGWKMCNFITSNLDFSSIKAKPLATLVSNHDVDIIDNEPVLYKIYRGLKSIQNVNDTEEIGKYNKYKDKLIAEHDSMLKSKRNIPLKGIFPRENVDANILDCNLPSFLNSIHFNTRYYVIINCETLLDYLLLINYYDGSKVFYNLAEYIVKNGYYPSVVKPQKHNIVSSLSILLQYLNFIGDCYTIVCLLARMLINHEALTFQSQEQQPMGMYKSIVGKDDYFQLWRYSILSIPQTYRDYAQVFNDNNYTKSRFEMVKKRNYDDMKFVENRMCDISITELNRMMRQASLTCRVFSRAQLVQQIKSADTLWTVHSLEYIHYRKILDTLALPFPLVQQFKYAVNACTAILTDIGFTALCVNDAFSYKNLFLNTTHNKDSIRDNSANKDANPMAKNMSTNSYDEKNADLFPFPQDNTPTFNDVINPFTFDVSEIKDAYKILISNNEAVQQIGLSRQKLDEYSPVLKVNLLIGTQASTLSHIRNVIRTLSEPSNSSSLTKTSESFLYDKPISLVSHLRYKNRLNDRLLSQLLMYLLDNKGADPNTMSSGGELVLLNYFMGLKNFGSNVNLPHDSGILGTNEKSHDIETYEGRLRGRIPMSFVYPDVHIDWNIDCGPILQAIYRSALLYPYTTMRNLKNRFKIRNIYLNDPYPTFVAAYDAYEYISGFLHSYKKNEKKSKFRGPPNQLIDDFSYHAIMYNIGNVVENNKIFGALNFFHLTTSIAIDNTLPLTCRGLLDYRLLDTNTMLTSSLLNVKDQDTGIIKDLLTGPCSKPLLKGEHEKMTSIYNIKITLFRQMANLENSPVSDSIVRDIVDICDSIYLRKPQLFEEMGQVFASREDIIPYQPYLFNPYSNQLDPMFIMYKPIVIPLTTRFSYLAATGQPLLEHLFYIMDTYGIDASHDLVSLILNKTRNQKKPMTKQRQRRANKRSKQMTKETELDNTRDINIPSILEEQKNGYNQVLKLITNKDFYNQTPFTYSIELFLRTGIALLDNVTEMYSLDQLKSIIKQEKDPWNEIDLLKNINKEIFDEELLKVSDYKLITKPDLDNFLKSEQDPNMADVQMLFPLNITLDKDQSEVMPSDTSYSITLRYMPKESSQKYINNITKTKCFNIWKQMFFSSWQNVVLLINLYGDKSVHSRVPVSFMIGTLLRFGIIRESSQVSGQNVTTEKQMNDTCDQYYCVNPYYVLLCLLNELKRVYAPLEITSNDYKNVVVWWDALADKINAYKQKNNITDTKYVIKRINSKDYSILHSFKNSLCTTIESQQYSAHKKGNEADKVGRQTSQSTRFSTPKEINDFISEASNVPWETNPKMMKKTIMFGVLMVLKFALKQFIEVTKSIDVSSDANPVLAQCFSGKDEIAASQNIFKYHFTQINLSDIANSFKPALIYDDDVAQQLERARPQRILEAQVLDSFSSLKALKGNYFKMNLNNDFLPMTDYNNSEELALTLGILYNARYTKVKGKETKYSRIPPEEILKMRKEILQKRLEAEQSVGGVCNINPLLVEAAKHFKELVLIDKAGDIELLPFPTLRKIINTYSANEEDLTQNKLKKNIIYVGPGHCTMKFLENTHDSIGISIKYESSKTHLILRMRPHAPLLNTMVAHQLKSPVSYPFHEMYHLSHLRDLNKKDMNYRHVSKRSRYYLHKTGANDFVMNLSMMAQNSSLIQWLNEVSCSDMSFENANYIIAAFKIMSTTFLYTRRMNNMKATANAEDSTEEHRVRPAEDVEAEMNKAAIRTSRRLQALIDLNFQNEWIDSNKAIRKNPFIDTYLSVYEDDKFIFTDGKPLGRRSYSTNDALLPAVFPNAIFYPLSVRDPVNLNRIIAMVDKYWQELSVIHDNENENNVSSSGLWQAYKSMDYLFLDEISFSLANDPSTQKETCLSSTFEEAFMRGTGLFLSHLYNRNEDYVFFKCLLLFQYMAGTKYISRWVDNVISSIPLNETPSETTKMLLELAHKIKTFKQEYIYLIKRAMAYLRRIEHFNATQNGTQCNALDEAIYHRIESSLSVTGMEELLPYLPEYELVDYVCGSYTPLRTSDKRLETNEMFIHRCLELVSIEEQAPASQRQDNSVQFAHMDLESLMPELDERFVRIMNKNQEQEANKTLSLDPGVYLASMPKDLASYVSERNKDKILSSTQQPLDHEKVWRYALKKAKEQPSILSTDDIKDMTSEGLKAYLRQPIPQYTYNIPPLSGRIQSTTLQQQLMKMLKNEEIDTMTDFPTLLKYSLDALANTYELSSEAKANIIYSSLKEFDKCRETGVGYVENNKLDPALLEKANRLRKRSIMNDIITLYLRCFTSPALRNL